MGRNTRKHRKVTLSDERIAAAAKLVCEAIVKSYWEDEKPDLEFSPEFERKMQRLIDSMDGNSQHPQE